MQEMTHRFTEELRRLKFENHDHCVSCGYNFKEGDTSHSGYSENDEALYVCDSCSTQLKETAVRNYFSAHPYEIPNEEAKGNLFSWVGQFCWLFNRPSNCR